jgi:hypothetical protein
MINHTINVLSQLIEALLVGTNLALLHFFVDAGEWGAVAQSGSAIPSAQIKRAIGCRRAWVAFRKGGLANASNPGVVAGTNPKPARLASASLRRLIPVLLLAESKV